MISRQNRSVDTGRNPRGGLSRRGLLLGGASTAGALGLGGCDVPKFVVDALLPQPVPLPDEAQQQAITLEAERLSLRLNGFIEAWLDGRGPAELPTDLLPVGIDPHVRRLRLARPETVRPEALWVIREACSTLDHERTPGLYPDPHCTYLVPGVFFAPFGTTAVLEGEFPHARFFSIQVTPPFDPLCYYCGGAYGVAEVPLVDVDIVPLPGHVNPFWPGSDRSAPRRGYRAEIGLVRGYGPAVEPAYRAPHYRETGNRRLGSGIIYQGPLGLPGNRLAHGRGVWDTGQLWLRYYAPDRDKGPLGGVPLPRLSFQTATGRRFAIVTDVEAKRRDFNKAAPIRRTDPEAAPRRPRPADVWSRELDILHTGLVGVFNAVGKTTPADRAQGKALIEGFTAHGPDVRAPGHYAASASRVPYISYLAGGASLGPDEVLVLTGRLPRFPRTLNGARRLTPGQVRYLSITAYAQPDFLNDTVVGQPLSSVMDEEIVADAQGRYILCYSRAETRPFNATPASGVTWIDWGPVASANFNMRWLTVHDQWKDLAITPDDRTVPYRNASFFEQTYDPTLVGLNGHSRIMGDYIPTMHILLRDAFVSLGGRPRANDFSRWAL